MSLFLDQVKQIHPEYHARPVLPFGDPNARLLIVGLAPGMHGANRTGRPFTGDFAGILLYETLYRYGFSSQPISVSAEDGLSLMDCRITNAVKCLPPQNTPEASEIKRCNPYLEKELKELAGAGATDTPRIVLALGGVAHRAVLMSQGLKQSAYPFGHGNRHELPHTLPSGLILFDSYHCSRYNTQTKRLTAATFAEVFARIRQEIDGILS